MVTVKVSEEKHVDGAELDGAAQELLLRSLAAVEEEGDAVHDDSDAGDVTLARRRTGTGAEEEDAHLIHSRECSWKPATVR